MSGLRTSGRLLPQVGIYRECERLAAPYDRSRRDIGAYPLVSAAYSTTALAVTTAAAIASLWSLFHGGPTAFRTWRK